ncbi:MAG: hypothetical protein Homavirus5_6 [Homavirus sp.]|uniref:Uncharacterized protein n=1 Tax=Homavirus sp. TaxID=2487769 RepID=A0A3G5A6F7_9VIRU|nr:MAG: hypothetical protein Homavirus5_6 [Homavirus sp.]
MNYIPYNELLIDSIELSDVVYSNDLNTYVSKLFYTIDNIFLENVPLKIPNFRLVKIFSKNQQNYIRVEFLANTDGNDFYQFINKLDNQIINNFVDKSEQMIGTKLNYNSVSSLYHKSKQLPKTIPSLPTMTFCIPDKCIILDKDDNQLSLENLEINNELKLVINFDSIIFYPNMYKLTSNVDIIKINSYFCSGYDCLFTEDE